jgi:hypothetical protein
MNNYTFSCESGAVVLVSAESKDEAESNWDNEVAMKAAEPRTTPAKPASLDEIERLEGSEHDYRGDDSSWFW